MLEQFVQDAISHPKRLQRVLRQLGHSDWYIDQSDVLNQEFNFAVTNPNGTEIGGRMDVLATFNGKTRLAVVETKIAANETDLQQLSWYVKHSSVLANPPESDFSAVDFSRTVGILLATEFAPGKYETSGCPIHCVRFGFDGNMFPFEAPARIPLASVEESGSTIVKRSRLFTINDHRERLREDLRLQFDELRHLCMSKADPRLTWLIENPKSGHVAIHYKGTYVVYFFVRKNSFDIGYTLPGGQGVCRRIGDGSSDSQQQMAELRREIPEVVADVDAKSQSLGIPPSFDWTAFE